MPSIFSRSSKSKASKQQLQLQQRSSTPDEFGSFGRVLSASSPPLPPKDTKKRQRTISGPTTPSSSRHPTTNASLPPSIDSPLPLLPDGTFYPLIIPSKRARTAPEYGYIGSETDVCLGLPEVLRLVDTVGHELTTRGVTTPLLFSTQALDVSSTRVRSLIRTFLATCQPSSPPPGPVRDSQGHLRSTIPPSVAEQKFREEVRFRGPHELGMLLKWALARIARVQDGLDVRGFIQMDAYFAWREREEELDFPANHFPSIYEHMPPPVHALFTSLFELFSRFCAYSSSSGLTPPALATHFGPLIFGLGAPSLSFGPTYIAYLHAVHATEHLILAYILNSDYEAPSGVELPSRLKDWIRGYPSMIPRTRADLDKSRPGVRTVHVASVRRNVRLYSTDLVSTATVWCGDGDLSGRQEWTRVVPNPKGDYSKPRYTEEYKKRLDLPKSCEPKTHYDPVSTPGETSPPPPYINPIDNLIARANPEHAAHKTVLKSDLINEDRFKNLADLEWNQFSELGFGTPDAKILQFDLGETARRNARNIRKRDTMSWNDFTAGGFDRGAAASPQPHMKAVSDPLAEALQFSVPQDTIATWNEHSSDLTRKLRKQQKALPAFGWDTHPVAGREWLVEEGMIQTWCELCLSSGWVDFEEGTFREANWALVQLRAIPSQLSSNASSTSLASRDGDPRVGSQWFLFEEFVPREYREQLTAPKKKSSLFSSLNGKQKAWKPAATLNGQPYTGRPRSPDPKDSEFDAMLRHSDAKTKIITLAPPPRSTSQNGSLPRTHYKSTADPPVTPRSFRHAPPAQIQVSEPTPPKSNLIPSPLYTLSSERPRTPQSKGASKFRIGKQKPPAAEWDSSIEFETRTESESEDSPGDAIRRRDKHNRRQSKDDAWVDIRVHGGDRDADEGAKRTSRSNSDPELARAEILRAIAAAPIRPGEDTDEEDDEPIPVSPPPGFRPSIDAESVPPTKPVAPAIRIRSATVSTAAVDFDERSEEPETPQRGTPNSSHLRRGANHTEAETVEDIIESMQYEEEELEPPSPSDYDQTSPGQMVFPSRATPNGLPPSPHPPLRATSPLERAASPSNIRPLPVPPPPQALPAPGPSAPAPKAAVSSLIQMWQKKDNGVPFAEPARPSRLPVKTGSPGPGATPPLVEPASPGRTPIALKPSGIPISAASSPAQNSLSPSRSRSPQPPAPAPVPIPLDVDLAPPPPITPHVEILRSPSPARYVHGAPLHNVLEEEEED